MFINPPYIRCPKCGEDAFGILMIGAQHYYRRCSACYYPDSSRDEDDEGYPLPKLNKKVIYIDQFSISNMMKFLNPDVKGHKRAGADVFWGDSFKSLNALCKLQLIICPDSDFHKYESIVAPYYQHLKQMYELFSCGVSFCDHEMIKAAQIMAQFRIWIGDINKINLDVHKITMGDINTWQDRYIISGGTYNSQALIDEVTSSKLCKFLYRATLPFVI